MMKRNLRFRLTVLFIGVAAGALIIAGIILLTATHHHFNLYQLQYGKDHNLTGLTLHLEQALLQSTVGIFAGAILLAAAISIYTAKRLSAPLMQMKYAAEQMTKGELDIRTNVTGNDELSDLGRALNHLAGQLQIQEQLRLTMTEDIAHELRTPLTTLKSHLLAMLDQIWEPTPERLRSCYEETERLISLVKDLEQLTIMDSPQFHLERKPEDLSALIHQSATLLSASYMEKRVNLEVNLCPNIRLWVDRDRAIQIMVNVLSNALRYTPEGGRVHVHATDEGETALIVVEDTGIGISPDDLPYVFERFYRADKSRNRKSGGGGIGLAIVKKLVDAHGGSIAIESATGTTVWIRLPVYSH